MSRKKIVIVGSNGRLGRALVDTCRANFDIAALTRHDLDLAWSEKRIVEALESGAAGADAVLLAAGDTNVDHCQSHPEEARQLNVTAVGDIARWSAQRGIRFISFSSDYVFDGHQEAPYTETDPIHPLSIYGQSKADGETATLEASPNHLVVRLTWLYGPGKALATPDWAVETAVKKDVLNVVADRVGCPSYTGDMAGALEPLIFDPRARGLLHLCNAGSCSWLEWAQYCVDCAVDCGVPVKTRTVGPLTMDAFFGNDRAARPRHTVLSTAKYQALAGRTLPDWREPLRRYIADHVAPRFLRA